LHVAGERGCAGGHVVRDEEDHVEECASAEEVCNWAC
jgi:hypothetical protein